jgi:hypothetical protein
MRRSLILGACSVIGAALAYLLSRTFDVLSDDGDRIVILTLFGVPWVFTAVRVPALWRSGTDEPDFLETSVLANRRAVLPLNAGIAGMMLGLFRPLVYPGLILFVGGFLLCASIYWFNRPSFLVPPALRSHPGALHLRRERRKRRVPSG